MKELKVGQVGAHILLLVVNLIYGANFSIAKVVMPRFIQPFGFIVYRVGFSLILYGVIYMLFIRERIAKKDYLRIVACGFFGIALNQLLFFKGISLTSSIHGSLLMIITPMITFLLSNILLKERIKAIQIVGLILGAIGAATLVINSGKGTGNASTIGDIYVIFNALSYAIYLIIVRPLMKDYHPITIIFLNFLTGFIWVFLAGHSEAMEISWQNIPTEYYWHFGFVIFGATFIVYLFNIIAIRSVSASTVSSYIYLQPLFAILISQIFTMEHLSFLALIAGFLIIFGLWLINSSETR